MGKKPANPYKLQPVAGKAEPKRMVMPRQGKPRPDLHIGQRVSCHFKPRNFDIADPAIVISITESSRYFSGWAIQVETSIGVQSLDSYYFKPYTAP